MAQPQEQSYLPEGAKLFTGRYIDAMPKLLKEGLVPVSPSWVMDERNRAIGTSAQDYFWTNYFDTDFGLAADRKKVYLFPHSKILGRVTSNTELVGDGIALTSKFKAKAYSRKDLRLDDALTEKEALEHTLWNELAEGNKERLGLYVQNAFKLGKDVHGYDEMMGFYVPEGNKPILRAVLLLRLDDRADALGSRFLGNYYARLLGVRSDGAPKARGREKIEFNTKDLESRLGSVAVKAGFNNPEKLADALARYKKIEDLF